MGWVGGVEVRGCGLYLGGCFESGWVRFMGVGLMKGLGSRGCGIWELWVLYNGIVGIVFRGRLIEYGFRIERIKFFMVLLGLVFYRIVFFRVLIRW